MQLGPDGCPVAANLHYEGPANQRRAKADTLSKVRLLCLACCILVAFTLLARPRVWPGVAPRAKRVHCALYLFSSMYWKFFD